jgi:hypothetical protein
LKFGRFTDLPLGKIAKIPDKTFGIARISGTIIIVVIMEIGVRLGRGL